MIDSNTVTISRTIIDENHIKSTIKVDTAIFNVKSIFSSEPSLQSIMFEIVSDIKKPCTYDKKYNDRR